MSIFVCCRFEIDYVRTREVYIINIDLSVCYDPDNCVVQTDILDNVEISPNLCDWNQTVIVKGDTKVMLFIIKHNILTVNSLSDSGWSVDLLVKCLFQTHPTVFKLS
mgnify:CR=1 FL=1